MMLWTALLHPCGSVSSCKARRRASWSEVVTVGLDIAKSVFQVHGVDVGGGSCVRPPPEPSARSSVLREAPGLPGGLEACGTAHYWGRDFRKFGHDARLMPPSYVKPYVKRQKNDAAYAAAICEAVTRPTMRFVEIKSPEQQSVMVLHRVRLTLMRQRIQLSNTILGHMAEFGLVAPIGRKGLAGFIGMVCNCDDCSPP